MKEPNRPPPEMVLLAFYTARAKQEMGDGSIQHEYAERALWEYCKKHSRTEKSTAATAEMRAKAELICMAGLASEKRGTHMRVVIAAIKAGHYSHISKVASVEIPEIERHPTR